jgi:predicted negative regulator of RcsB-dependent stress response
MSAYDHEEQEQLAAIKGWWHQYGGLALLGVTLALGAAAAWNGWQWYQRSKAVEAAQVYAELQRVAGSKDLGKVKAAAGSIIENYPRTIYAPLAALTSAKAHFDGNDLKTARVQVQWAVDNARDPEIQAIARLRLATLLIDEKAYDDALKVLDAKHDAAFAGRFLEVRGDVLAAAGKKADARAAYKAAMDKADPRDPTTRELLQMKLDGLGDA